MSRRRVLGASLVAFIPLTNVMADNDITNPVDPQPASRPVVSGSAPPSDDTAALPVITVNAEKAGRSLMNTGTSTVVFDQHDLESRAGMTTTRDVIANVPNVVLVGTGNTAPTVRGVDGTGASQGADAFFAGSRPRLNVQIDGRPASYNEIVFGDTTMWDVKQVEVLLGPQSTLQGRNAIAGTIATKTNDPTFYNESAFQLSGGNYDSRRASAMVSGPIIDHTLAYRFAADYLTKTSFVNGWSGFPSVDDPRDFRSLNLRGKLLYQSQSAKDFKALLTLNHTDYLGPQTEDVNRPFSDHHSDFVFEPVFEPKTTSAILDTHYAFNSKFSFDGLLSGTDLNVKRKSPAAAGIVNIDGREYVFEPKIRYKGDGRASAVAGIYLFRSHQDESIDFPSSEVFDDRVTTEALFGEGTLPVTDVLDVIAGIRFEREQHERNGHNVNSSDPLAVRIDVDNTDTVALPKIGLAWHVKPQTTLGIQVSRGYNGGGGGFVVVPDPADPTKSQITNYEYASEHVWTYELYGRQELANGRVRLTGNLFYSDYRDMQLSYDLTPADPTDFSFIVKNADKVTTYGSEVGATWLVESGLEVYANIGLLKAEITDYPNSGFQGNDLPRSPVFTSAAGVTWKKHGWDASLSTRYSAAYYSDIENNPRGRVEPYWVANSQLGYTISNVRIYGAVNNLFDSDKPVAVFSGATEADDTAEILPPRTAWAGVQVAF